MENLEHVLKELKGRKNHFPRSYFVPAAWNFFAYPLAESDRRRPGELKVNPYDFYSHCIERRIMSLAGVPTAPKLEACTIYSMLPRMFSAWTHYERNTVCPGTFLKSMCLLPYLKSLGVDLVYLLPVFQYSDRHKKGEVGSPYSIKNIYRVDSTLHDPLLGSAKMIDVEFKAFVEACHLLGLKVIIDFVFRTVARDNDLLVEHPEWFYWIYSKYEAGFSAPRIERVKGAVPLNDRALKLLYRSKSFKDYLSQFTFPPNKLDPLKWQNIVRRHKKSGANILDLIESAFKITTAPGFSDVINDSQPPWTDVTYLKFYFDLHKEAECYLPPNQAPYISQDVAKLSVYHGSKPNRELWKYICQAIPYWQEVYGIDGVRIDMGHALPEELNRRIIKGAKVKDKKVILWSEELNPRNAAAAEKAGYQFISGGTWKLYKEFEKPRFMAEFLDATFRVALPVTAALEIPDTPRIAFLVRDLKKLEFLIWLQFFTPNAIPLINNGLELMEVQPMNLGLGNTEQGRFVLPKSDPMYGKLAFFDNYCLHWLNPQREWMQKTLRRAAQLRRRFISLLSRKECFQEKVAYQKNRRLVFFLYLEPRTTENVFFIGNLDFKASLKANFNSLLPAELRRKCRQLHFIYSNYVMSAAGCEISRVNVLKAGEFLIGQAL